MLAGIRIGVAAITQPLAVMHRHMDVRIGHDKGGHHVDRGARSRGGVVMDVWIIFHIAGISRPYIGLPQVIAYPALLAGHREGVDIPAGRRIHSQLYQLPGFCDTGIARAAGGKGGGKGVGHRDRTAVTAGAGGIDGRRNHRIQAILSAAAVIRDRCPVFRLVQAEVQRILGRVFLLPEGHHHRGAGRRHGELHLIAAIARGPNGGCPDPGGLDLQRLHNIAVRRRKRDLHPVARLGVLPQEEPLQRCGRRLLQGPHCQHRCGIAVLVDLRLRPVGRKGRTLIVRVIHPQRKELSGLRVRRPLPELHIDPVILIGHGGIDRDRSALSVVPSVAAEGKGESTACGVRFHRVDVISRRHIDISLQRISRMGGGIQQSGTGPVAAAPCISDQAQVGVQQRFFAGVGHHHPGFAASFDRRHFEGDHRTVRHAGHVAHIGLSGHIGGATRSVVITHMDLNVIICRIHMDQDGHRAVLQHLRRVLIRGQGRDGRRRNASGGVVGPISCDGHIVFAYRQRRFIIVAYDLQFQIMRLPLRIGDFDNAVIIGHIKEELILICRAADQLSTGVIQHNIIAGICHGVPVGIDDHIAPGILLELFDLDALGHRVGGSGLQHHGHLPAGPDLELIAVHRGRRNRSLRGLIPQLSAVHGRLVAQQLFRTGLVPQSGRIHADRDPGQFGFPDHRTGIGIRIGGIRQVVPILVVGRLVHIVLGLGRIIRRLVRLIGLPGLIVQDIGLDLLPGQVIVIIGSRPTGCRYVDPLDRRSRSAARFRGNGVLHQALEFQEPGVKVSDIPVGIALP